MAETEKPRDAPGAETRWGGDSTPGKVAAASRQAGLASAAWPKKPGYDGLACVQFA